MASALLVGLVVAGWPSRGGQPEPVDRVIVVSVPTLTWADMDPETTPHLIALVDDSIIANLSPNTAIRQPSPGDAYVTLGAGARARGAPGSDGIAREGADGSVRHRGVEQIALRNAGLPFGAEVGALGATLTGSGQTPAVIANADGAQPGTGRQAVVAAMDVDGTVTRGEVGARLLTPDPGAAFGHRLDAGQVVGSFRRMRSAAVVLVEASDLARVDAYGEKVDPREFARARLRALTDTDALVGRLLAEIDPERDAVLLVAPYAATGRPAVTVAALRAPGVTPGLMRSSVTRRSGSVTLVDVAPTILHLVAVDAPPSMEGRPFERGVTGGSPADRRAKLEAEDADTRGLARQAYWLPRVFVAAEVALALVALVALVVRAGRAGPAHRRGWRVLEAAALALIAVGPVVYLSRLVPFGSSTVTMLAITAGAAGVGAGAALVPRRHPLDPLAGVLALVVATVVGDAVSGNPLQFNSVFGYSPVVAARFQGIGNLAFAQLAAGGILLAGLLAARIGGRTGRRWAAGLLGALVVIDGAPWWGSDVGGMLALVPAAGVTLVLLGGRRPRLRTSLLLLAATVAVVAMAALIDLALPQGSQTHLARLVDVTSASGSGSFTTVVGRKLHASLSTFGAAPWSLMLPLAGCFVGALLWLAPDRLRRLETTFPPVVATAGGLGVVAVLGSFLNDSGLQVAGMVLAVSVPALVVLLVAGRSAAATEPAASTVGARPVDGEAPAPPPTRGGTEARVAMAALTAGALALRIPSLLAGRHFSYHEGVFGLTAVAMRAGSLPFRDVPSPQGPLFPAVLWLGDVAGLRSANAPRVVAVVAGVVATAAAYVVGRRLSTPTGGALAAVLVGASGSVLWVTGPLASDGVAMALALTALVLATSGTARAAGGTVAAGAAGSVGAAAMVGAAGAGGALAAAVAVKVLVAPAVVPVVGFVALRRGRRGVAWLAVAAVVTTMVLWVPWGAARAWDQSVRYHLDGRRLLPVAEAWSLIGHLLRDRDPMLVAAAAAAGVSASVVVVRLLRQTSCGRGMLRPWVASHRPRVAAAALLAAWAVLELLVLLAEPAFFTHHAAVVVPPLALLVVTVTPTSAIVSVALVAVAMFPWQFDRSVISLLTPGRYEGAEAAAVGDLRALTPQSQVISDNPGLVWRAGRSSPPELVDVADKAIEEHRITTASVLVVSARSEVCAVLVWERSLGAMLPGLSDGLEGQGYVASEYYGTITLDHRSQPVLRTLWVKPACPVGAPT